MKKKIVTQDILQIKQSQLDTYVAQYDTAVSLVTGTIEQLGIISQGIATTISEIDEYQKQLENTKADLAATKAKNDRVVANFRALLCED